MADRIAIVSAERVRDELSKLLVSRAAARRARGARRHRAGRPRAARAARAAPRDRRAPPAQGRLRALADRAGPGDRPGDRPRRRRCPARTWCCGSRRCCTTSASRATRRFEAGGGVSFHHHEVVGAKLVAKRLKALRFDKATVAGGRAADRAAPALPRVRRGRVDRLGRAPLRHRRRPAARAAAPADPVGLHHAQPAQGGPAVRGVRRPRGAGSPQLREQEELGAIRPDLDGTQIMEILGLAPGREVGEAYKHLLELRMERGPLGPDAAREELLAGGRRAPDHQQAHVVLLVRADEPLDQPVAVVAADVVGQRRRAPR